MPRFLALDWGPNQLHIIAANISGSKVTVQRASVWQEDEAPTVANAQQLGLRLRARLKAAGIAPAPVLACVGRERVILKELRFPVVPPSEEPAIVRFQAVKEIVDSPDDVVIDYVPLGETNSLGGAERRAQALILRRDVLTMYQELCQAAGLKLQVLSPRSLGMAACLRQVMGSSPLTPPPSSPDATVAVVVIAERFAELCIFRGDTPLLSRSLPVTPQLAGEVRRSLAVYNGQAPEQAVEAVYVAGHGTPEVRLRLVEMIEVPVHTFDPFSQSELAELPTTNRGTFAGAAGLLFSLARSGQLAINFASPRQPVEKKSGSPRKVVYALVAAVVMFLAGGIVTRGLYGNVISQEEEVKLNRKSVENDLQKTRAELKRIKALNDWDSVVWLDEIYELTRRIPDVDAMRITSLSGEPVSQKGAKSRFTAVYTLKGKLLTPNKHPTPLDQLVDEFNKKEHSYYSAERPDLKTDETTKEVTFRMRVFVERRAPEAYTSKFDPPPRPKASPKSRFGKGGKGGKWGGKDFKGWGKGKGKGKAKGMEEMDDDEPE